MVRLCVIGAGPSGMSVLYHVRRIKKEKPDVDIEVVCFEKQDNWGGLWRYNWRVGLDEYGEYVHNSQYRQLWSNGPKEASLEFPEYTYEDHFGRPIGSFPPRDVIFDYLKTRWERNNLRSNICFLHVVKSVGFDPITRKFIVAVKDLENDIIKTDQVFDYVLNCTGHFSVPSMPKFEGMETFPGRIMHSHDFRSAEEFAGKRLLVLGAHYSSEDIALQTMKFGAKSVICSYRTIPTGFKWPWGIQERPLLSKVEGKKVTFRDGSTAEVDAIICGTGYLHHYPYLSEELRLKGPNEMYNPNLYKGTVWMKGGEGAMLYIGCQDYTFSMFDAQARWAIKYIVGDIKMPRKELALQDMKKWRQEALKRHGHHEEIDFQSDFVNDLVRESEYGYDLDIGYLFHDWEDNKLKDILTYRDQPHESKFTGKPTPRHHTKWADAMDDSKEAFLAQK